MVAWMVVGTRVAEESAAVAQVKAAWVAVAGVAVDLVGPMAAPEAAVVSQ